MTCCECHKIIRKEPLVSLVVWNDYTVFDFCSDKCFGIYCKDHLEYIKEAKK